MAIEEAADTVVSLGQGIAKLVLVLEQVFEDQLSECFVLIRRCDFGRFDLTGDVALFVGEEDELVTVADDQVFLFQALQGAFKMTTQGKLVGVDLLDGQSDQIVERTFDSVDIANHE